MLRILKIWGIRDRIFKSDTCEVDYLELYPNSQCSVHFHDCKFNKFIVTEGEVIIKTGFDEILLKKGDKITVEPPLVHQFITLDLPAKMIEIAYVKEGRVLEDDINRAVQGGRTIDDKFYTLEEMQDKHMIDMMGDLSK